MHASESVDTCTPLVSLYHVLLPCLSLWCHLRVNWKVFLIAECCVKPWWSDRDAHGNKPEDVFASWMLYAGKQMEVVVQTIPDRYAHGNKSEDVFASWMLLCASVYDGDTCRNKSEAVFDSWMLCAWLYVPDGDAHRNKPEDVLDSCMLLCAGGVYRAEKHTGANLKMLVQGLSTRPMGIIAYSASRQKCECMVVTCLWTAATSALDHVTVVLFSFGIIMIVEHSLDKRYKIMGI